MARGPVCTDGQRGCQSLIVELGYCPRGQFARAPRWGGQRQWTVVKAQREEVKKPFIEEEWNRGPTKVLG